MAKTKEALQDELKRSEAKKAAEKLMRKYNMLDAIIESKRIDVESYNLTQSFNVSEAQRGNQFHSETERLAIIAAELRYYENIKRQLTNVYNCLKPVQKIIWERRYIDEEKDNVIIGELYDKFYMNDKKYYRLKKDMLTDVIKALSLDV